MFFFWFPVRSNWSKARLTITFVVVFNKWGNFQSFLFDFFLFLIYGWSDAADVCLLCFVWSDKHRVDARRYEMQYLPAEASHQFLLLVHVQVIAKWWICARIKHKIDAQVIVEGLECHSHAICKVEGGRSHHSHRIRRRSRMLNYRVFFMNQQHFQPKTSNAQMLNSVIWDFLECWASFDGNTIHNSSWCLSNISNAVDIAYSYYYYYCQCLFVLIDKMSRTSRRILNCCFAKKSIKFDQ